jgi:23S rRNA (uracil1939-C5)-methyltransferase
MLARLDGRVVLVAGALPGETVRARIERADRGLAFARVEAVLSASPDRRTPPFDPACGGGVYAHVRPEAQPAPKRDVLIDGLRHGAGVAWTGPLPVHGGAERGYRLRARLHVRGRRVGFFKEGTHELCDAAPSAQLMPETLAAVERVAAALPSTVALDSIEVSENLDGSERALHLHPRDDSGVVPPSTPESISGITGISWANSTSTPESVYGDPRVGDEVARFVPGATPGIRLRRHAASFFQGNRFLLGALASAVVDAVPEGPVWDLYAGVGLFGVSLCALGRDAVTAVEGDPVSGADLAANAAAFGGRLRADARPVERVLAETGLPAEATVVVDPPRTGLSKAAGMALAASAVRRIVYVSCDVATLARDVRILGGAGFAIEAVSAFDLFPNTAHVEALVVLAR